MDTLVVVSSMLQMRPIHLKTNSRVHHLLRPRLLLRIL